MKNKKMYFIKLKNNEKLDCTETEFNTGLHNKAGDFIVIKTPNGNDVFIKKVEVLLGGYYIKSKYNPKKGKQ